MTEEKNKPIVEKSQVQAEQEKSDVDHSLKCPKCGSADISVQAVAETSGKTKGKTKGFGCIKSILGAITVPGGFFCGLCGMGKGKTKGTVKTKIKQIRVCQNCGDQW